MDTPLFIFVSVEAEHHDFGFVEWIRGIVKSPEWCIGTAVMSFQAVRLYMYGTSNGPRKSPVVFVTLTLVACIITGVAFYLLSKHEHSTTISLLKWLMFGVASVFLILFGGAVIWSESNRTGE